MSLPKSIRFHRMTEHISRLRIDQFRARSLETEELVTIWEHLDSCDACHRLFQEGSQSRRHGAPISFNLSPDYWLQDEHFDYETMAGYVDQTLDGEMREIADLHLKACTRCLEDLNRFVDFRQQIEPELNVRYGPDTRSSVAEWIES